MTWSGDPVMLDHLRKHGALATAEALMAQDLLDIEAGTIMDGTMSASEVRARLATYL